MNLALIVSSQDLREIFHPPMILRWPEDVFPRNGDFRGKRTIEMVYLLRDDGQFICDYCFGCCRNWNLKLYFFIYSFFLLTTKMSNNFINFFWSLSLPRHKTLTVTVSITFVISLKKKTCVLWTEIYISRLDSIWRDLFVVYIRAYSIFSSYSLFGHLNIFIIRGKG